MREPILGAWAAEGVRRLRYFVNYKGVPVAEVPQSRLEIRFQLELPAEGKGTPDKSTTPGKRSQRVVDSAGKSRAGTPMSSTATTPTSMQKLALQNAYAADIKSEAETSEYQSLAIATPDGLRPHPQIPAAPSPSPVPMPPSEHTSGDEGDVDAAERPLKVKLGNAEERPLKRKLAEDEEVVAAAPAGPVQDEQRVPDSTLVSPTAPGSSRNQTPKAQKPKKPRSAPRPAAAAPPLFDTRFLVNLEHKLQTQSADSVEPTGDSA